MEILQRIWQENKRFLLTVGGGFALFLVLDSCALEGFLNAASNQRRKNQKVEQEVTRLQGEVFARAGEEMKTLEDLARIEKEISGRYLTAPAADVPDTKRGVSPQIQFSSRIDQIWTEVGRKATQKNVKLPEKITTNDLGVSQNDGPLDHERSAQYLEILGRALNVCVDQGTVQIERPVIHPEEVLPVPRNEDAEMVYRRVGLTVHGPFASFKRVLREFQSPPFIQARLLNLDARGSGGVGALRGQIEFAGIRIYREGDEVVKEAPPSKREPKKKRGKS